MSRCFPYPPPGYALSSARKDALIESIKFQKEKVKAEEHKKDKKREKKEKRKDKSDKKEKKDKKSQKHGMSDVVHSSYEGKKYQADSKAEFLLKGSKAESEQLERSSLTEEHAKPVSLRVPSSSSDSTENSNNKRKRQPSPVDVSRGHGKIIRIRLSSKKQNQSDSVVNEQKECSTSGRIHAPPQPENDIAPRLRNEGLCSTSGSIGNVGQCLVLKTGGERFHVASKPIETAPPPPPLETKALPAVLTAMQKEGIIYRNLIENWVPPQMHYGCVETGDDDWLFGGKNKVERSDQSQMCRDDSVLCSNTLLLWPRAQFLPEVDLYALPYTVPF